MQLMILWLKINVLRQKHQKLDKNQQIFKDSRILSPAKYSSIKYSQLSMLLTLSLLIRYRLNQRQT